MGGPMWGFICCIVLFCCAPLYSQTLLEEDFGYPSGDSLVSHGWLAHLSAGTNSILVISPGLVYAGHPGSGSGNAARLYQTGEDVNRTIAVPGDADIYVSFLVRVQDATTSSSEHFLHLNIGTHVGRIFVKKSGEQIAFGASKSSEAATFTDAVYALNTVYLVVLRYTHVSGNDNDVVRLFVMDSGVPAAEPDPTLGPITSVGTEPLGITAVALRQGGSVVTDIVVDGIRVGTSWNEAGLPVTFSSFTADETDGNVKLRWRTESEVGNHGFDIERRAVHGSTFIVQGYEPMNHKPETWNRIGFIKGSGTSSSPRDYSFIDKPDQPGRYAYRIKQIDLSGIFTYTASLEVNVRLAQGTFPLLQNYPNPFNPSTTIRFSLEEQASTNVRVYDTAGRIVRILANEVLQPGWHAIDFIAEGLASGTYLVRLEAGGRTSILKISLLR